MGIFSGETYLLLGGAGMVGQQIAREVAREMGPQQIVISGLLPEEVSEAVAGLRRDFPKVLFTPAPGDIFVRSEWNPPKRSSAGFSTTKRISATASSRRGARRLTLALSRDPAHNHPAVTRPQPHGEVKDGRIDRT